MTWIALTENPKAITSIFERPPSLAQVDILSINVKQDGPTVGLIVALNDYPASPPDRWHNDANAVTLALQLMAVQFLELSGWSTTNIATITFERERNGSIELLANGPTLRLRCSCGFVRVDHISPYRREIETGG